MIAFLLLLAALALIGAISTVLSLLRDGYGPVRTVRDRVAPDDRRSASDTRRSAARTLRRLALDGGRRRGGEGERLRASVPPHPE